MKPHMYQVEKKLVESLQFLKYLIGRPNNIIESTTVFSKNVPNFCQLC